MSTAKSDKAALAAPAIEWDWLRVIAMLLCVAGILVAGYMSWAEVTGNETVCADTGKIDCAAVQESAYAKTFGLPVAIMGLLGYAAMLGVLVLEDQVALAAEFGRVLVLGMALFGVIFQTYLTYVEASVLDKWCQWCVTSYVIIALILVVSAYRQYELMKPLRR